MGWDGFASMLADFVIRDIEAYSRMNPPTGDPNCSSQVSKVLYVCFTVILIQRPLIISRQILRIIIKFIQF